MARAVGRAGLTGLAAGLVAGVLLTLGVVLALGLGDDEDDAAATTAGPQTFTLRDGDVALRAEAATRCEAAQEAGLPNLFCTRTSGGRYDVLFYAERVLVFRVGEPEEQDSYGWGAP